MTIYQIEAQSTMLEFKYNLTFKVYMLTFFYTNSELLTNFKNIFKKKHILNKSLLTFVAKTTSR